MKADWMFDDLIRFHTPEGKRAAQAEGGIEHYLDEGAVMVAFAMHLLRTLPDLEHVSIHPDGMHGKTFDFTGWLLGQGFKLTEPRGTTSYGGLYASTVGRTIEIYPMPGKGDVVGGNITAECKGGVLNSTYAGQTSKLRKGLNETIGQSMTAEMAEGKRQFVVVPKAPATEALAKKISARCRKAGIEIALVDGQGNVFDVA